LPLLSQFWTASRLNVSSNLRRVLTGVEFMGLLVHCSPNSPSVNSKQPHTKELGGGGDGGRFCWFGHVAEFLQYLV
jgi:hypothetical protein